MGFYQGSELWNNVEVFKVSYDHKGVLTEADETEKLPHPPDAFFALHLTDAYFEKPELVFGKIWAAPADDDTQPVFQPLID